MSCSSSNERASDGSFRFPYVSERSIDKLTPFSSEHRVLRPDGSITWMSVRSLPRRRADGSHLWTGVAIDITEEKRAREEYRQLFAQMLDGFALHEIISDEYVRLVVADRGAGMSQEVLAHLFEPFFTTKRAGAGSGLGLSVVYGIVKQHGGYLSVESEPGRGTSVSIYLPGIDAAGGVRIVLVEDVESIRRIASRALEENCYQVLAFPSAEAIERHGSGGRQIELLAKPFTIDALIGKVDRLVRRPADAESAYPFPRDRHRTPRARSDFPRDRRGKTLSNPTPRGQDPATRPW